MARLRWATAAAAVCLAAHVAASTDRTVVVPCNGGFMGLESGFIVAVMPPDRASPEGGQVAPGGNLVLGDTVGRTPGAYGFFVSCDLTGYVGPADRINAGVFVAKRSGGTGMSPFSPDWKTPKGASWRTHAPSRAVSHGCAGALRSRVRCWHC
jgi:hypothetical protein